MRNKLSITLLVDEAVLPINPDTSQDYREDQSTEFHILKTLTEQGHSVSVVGIFDDVEPVVRKLKETKPEVVMNLTEQFRNSRWLDKDIAGLLELLDIPFTGAGSTGLMLSRNKAIGKQILGTRRIHVPHFITLPPGKSVRLPRSITFPLVVKPLLEDASEGISNNSLARTPAEVKERAEMIHDRWHQPAIAEQYIEGRELYISVLGNMRLRVLPIREIVFDGTKKNGPVMATERVKWNTKYREKWNIRFETAVLDEKIERKIAHVCKNVFYLLHLNDYARIDMRLSSDHKIYILEANANPNLHYFDELAESARSVKMSYADLLHSILFAAINRHRMSH